MKLTREDWVAAAYRALLRGGPKAVAVANLAAELGVTRGSFYHYFDHRQELLIAALEKWEHEATETFIDRASGETDPLTRLQRLLAQVLTEPTELAVAERRLLADRSEDRAVSEVVDRVIARRQSFLADCYQALGYGKAAAQDRATVAYMMFTGWLYLEQPVDQRSSAATRRIAALARELLSPAE